MTVRTTLLYKIRVSRWNNYKLKEGSDWWILLGISSSKQLQLTLPLLLPQQSNYAAWHEGNNAAMPSYCWYHGNCIHQSLILALTGQGCALGMLELRAHGTTNLTASTQRCSGILKGDALHPPSCSQGWKSWLDKKHVLCTELGLKEEWGGTSQSDRLWSPTCQLKPAWASPGAGPTSQGWEICSWCSLPLLTLGERCTGDVTICFHLNCFSW